MDRIITNDHPKLLLCIKFAKNPSSNFEILGHNNLYVRRVNKKKACQLLQFSSVYLNMVNRGLFDILQNMFLMEDVFSGVNHSFLFCGKHNTGKTYTLVGGPSNPGILLHFVQQLFQEVDSSYRFNTKVLASFLQYRNGVFNDLLQTEVVSLRFNQRTGTLGDPLAMRLDGVGDFMRYLKVALTYQMSKTSKISEGVLFVRLKVLSYNQYDNTYRESTIYFADTQTKLSDDRLDAISDCLLSDKLAGDRAPLSLFMKGTILRNSRVYAVCCISQQQLSSERELQTLRTLQLIRTLPITYQQNHYQHLNQNIKQAIQTTYSQYNLVQRFIGSSTHSKNKLKFIGQSHYQVNRLFDCIDHVLAAYQLNMLAYIDEIRRVCSGRKEVRESLLNDGNGIKRDSITEFWNTPVRKVRREQGHTKKQLMEDIQRFLQELPTKFEDVKNLLKFGKAAREGCNQLLTLLTHITGAWSNVLLTQTRHDLIEKFVTREHFQQHMDWLKGQLRTLKKATAVSQGRETFQLQQNIQLLNKQYKCQSVSKLATKQHTRAPSLNQSHFQSQHQTPRKLSKHRRSTLRLPKFAVAYRLL